jgi:hypothetical protein
MGALMRPLMFKAETSAERVLYLATSLELNGISGKYFGDKKELPAPKQADEAASRQKLWDLSVQLTGLA